VRTPKRRALFYETVKSYLGFFNLSDRFRIFSHWKTTKNQKARLRRDGLDEWIAVRLITG